jgi:uncharacterized protein (TIGR00251 family)
MATVTLKVVPRAARPGLTLDANGELKVRLAAPPVDGAANTELIVLLADALGVAKRAVAIVGGAQSRTKRVTVEGMTSEQAAARLVAAARRE